jgi:hypothetical protein
MKLKKEIYLENLIFIKNNKNLGYSGGNNLGIKVALENGADYVFILNNDTLIDSNNFLNPMIETMEIENKIGILGPELKNLNNKKIISDYNKSFFWKLINNFLKIDSSSNKVSRVSGAAILIRRDVFSEIGFFDEDFFMYAEENDFCIRSIKKGFDVFYYKNKKVYRESSQNSDSYLQFRNYYDSRNTFYLINKNFESFEKLILYFVFTLVLLKNIFKYILQGKPKISFSILKGGFHYFLGIKGKSE